MRFDVPIDRERIVLQRRRARKLLWIQLAAWLVLAAAMVLVQLFVAGGDGFWAVAVTALIVALIPGVQLFGMPRWFTGENLPPIALTLHPAGVTWYVERGRPREVPWARAQLSIVRKRGRDQLRMDSPGLRPHHWATEVLTVPPAEIDRAIRTMTNGQRALER